MENIPVAKINLASPHLVLAFAQFGKKKKKKKKKKNRVLSDR
jgi:hypothetical protein